MARFADTVAGALKARYLPSFKADRFGLREKVPQDMASNRLDELLAAGSPLEVEMRKERAPTDLLSWIDDLHDELAASDEDRKRLRLATGPIKLLFEEVRPLALFGMWLARRHSQLTVQPMASKGPSCDGILRSPDWPSPQKIEVTLAIDGYHQHLRMLHLNRFGRAPSVGQIGFVRKEGRPRPLDTPPMMRASVETRANIYTLMRNAAERKLRKLYSRDTWLLIVFDDNVGFAIGEKLRDDAAEEFQEFFQREILALPWQIEAVFAIGSSGRLVAGSDTHRS